MRRSAPTADGGAAAASACSAWARPRPWSLLGCFAVADPDRRGLPPGAAVRGATRRAGWAAGVIRVGGMPLAQLAVQRLRWWHGTRAGYTSYRAEVVRRHTGVLQLPGTLAATELLSAEDGRGGRYGLVRDRHTGYLTATLRVAPVSTWLADPADADQWVANWAAWLASLGYLPALRWVTVTVDTAPDPGSTLTGQVAAAIDPSAPRAAVEIMDQLVATAPAAAADVDTWVSITFDPAAFPAQPARPRRRGDRDRAGAGSAWNRRWAPAGSPCWAGPAPPTSPGMVRIAFDPAVRGEISRLLATGISPALEEQLNWASAGPAGAEERWDCYQHDSGTSVTWTWREAPRQNVTSDVLARLLAPGAYPKRVSLQYRPLPAAAAAADAGQRGPGGGVPPASTPAAPAATSPPATSTTRPAPGRPPTRKPAAPGSACSACT